MQKPREVEAAKPQGPPPPEQNVSLCHLSRDVPHSHASDGECGHETARKRYDQSSLVVSV